MFYMVLVVFVAFQSIFLEVSGSSSHFIFFFFNFYFFGLV